MRWLVLLAMAGCGLKQQEPSTLPKPPISRAAATASWVAAKQVFEDRCVVCHGCYDAPCQLKLDSYAGISRGATEQKVYEGTRLKEAPLTRLDIDAHDVAGWRQKRFHAVLPEGTHRDPQASVLLRMLALKGAHPLPAEPDLTKEFTFTLDRKQTCTDDKHFDSYAKEHPLWGMPYGLPPLSDGERHALESWIADGAPYSEPPALPSPSEDAIKTWEAFLNQPSLKSQLMSRYIYEHLFLASLYFKDLQDSKNAEETPAFFRLVRSRTAPGTAVDEIATRRPFDDPASEHLYYRLVRRTGPPLSKTQMVYALDRARLALYESLFLKPDYTVAALPAYDSKVGANPFRAFARIPARSRYLFMLTEAEFTLMGFIKGPVCRGQLAVNVIQDRFWVLFQDPDVAWMPDEAAFLASEQPDLDMPAEAGSSSLSVLWNGYGRAHDRYVKKRNAFLSGHAGALNVNAIWDGDGRNANAALTVFRHFDNATVVEGLVGPAPKTAWVIDYPLLERIHYLLVAGFDVFGNVGHQVSTRIYMDFLRLEGEANFLMLLPPERRKILVASWYRGTSGSGKERIETELVGFPGTPKITYRTRAPERELFEMLRTRVKGVLAHRYDLPSSEKSLTQLGAIHGLAASWLPETSFLTVRDGATTTQFTILRESAHENVAHLFHESAQRLKAEDALSVVPGFLGAYPNALFAVDRADLDGFVTAVAALDSAASYRSLRLRYGVLRNSARFWPHSDLIQRANHELGPIDGGLLDYNHLEAL